MDLLGVDFPGIRQVFDILCRDQPAVAIAIHNLSGSPLLGYKKLHRRPGFVVADKKVNYVIHTAFRSLLPDNQNQVL